MSFLINSSDKDAISGNGHKRYLAYLNSIEDRLPKRVYEFAIADWHYDFTMAKCPHDAWVQEIKIRETAEGERQQIRRVQIEVILLGAFHDRLLKVTYFGVSSHSIKSMKSQNGYGDWLVDEIGLSEAGMVIHWVKFSHDTFLTVECVDMTFEEQLTSKPYEAKWESPTPKSY